MDIQLISLLAAVITIITGILSLSKDLRKTSILHLIKILCCYSMPILFIQQIILFVNMFQHIIIPIYIVALFFMIRTQYNEYKIIKPTDKVEDFINENKESFLACVIVVISVIAFYIGEYWSRDFIIPYFKESRKIFIETLNTYKINTEMFIFLKNNIFMTFCMIFDILNLLLMFHSIKYQKLSFECNTYLIGKYYESQDKEKTYLKKPMSSYNLEDLKPLFRENIILSNKALKLSIISYCISSGLLFWFIKLVINFF
ncbi:MAG: hypothetical protein ACLSGX_06225 [Pseudoruminococcus massiliensis]|uniref:hypothetical protein n=1 Tax=Pseudoruminococcus massiliensis TaxID=2086583 RepID=UPI003995024D|nr:hypothetical protein [Oscillospiraceae bacterium]